MTLIKMTTGKPPGQLTKEVTLSLNETLHLEDTLSTTAHAVMVLNRHKSKWMQANNCGKRREVWTLHPD